MTKDNSDAMFTPEPKNNRRAILIVVLGLIVISACYFYITSNYKVSSSDKSSKVEGYITNLKNKNKTVKLKEEFGLGASIDRIMSALNWV